MKTVTLALLLLLVAFNHSEALKCYCGGQRFCPSSTETCVGSSNVCTTVTVTAGFKTTYSKGCRTASDCNILNSYPGLASCVSCGFDLCNR